MPIEWAKSADKHDIPRGDALYAVSHSIFESQNVRWNGVSSRHESSVFIGPPHSQTDRLLEVILEKRPPNTLWIYHVMQLGPLYRRLMEEES